MSFLAQRYVNYGFELDTSNAKKAKLASPKKNNNIAFDFESFSDGSDFCGAEFVFLSFFCVRENPLFLYFRAFQSTDRQKQKKAFFSIANFISQKNPQTLAAGEMFCEWQKEI